MRILLITDQYPPEIRSISSMVRDLAEGLAARGHQVWVVASYPRPMLVAGTVPAVPRRSLSGGVRLYRVHTFHYQRHYWIRGLGELLLPFVFLAQAATGIPPAIDVVLMYSPPLTLTTAARIIKRLTGARFILNVQDIFPQNAIDLGIIRHRPLIRLFEHIERQAYRAADHVTTHSRTSTEFLVRRKSVPAGKVSTVHNWLDVSRYADAAASGGYRRRFGVENKFVFLMAGFLGPSQELDLILRVAADVRDLRDLCFLFLGDGSEKRRLLEIQRRERLENVLFFPPVSAEDYPAVVKEMDVGIASLSSRNTTPVYPGKIVGFMAASKPVLAMLHAQSDGHVMIREAQCGYSVMSGDHGAATELVRRMYRERDSLADMGRRGFEYARRHFSRDDCIDAFDEIVRGGRVDRVAMSSAYETPRGA